MLDVVFPRTRTNGSKIAVKFWRIQVAVGINPEGHCWKIPQAQSIATVQFLNGKVQT